MALPLAATRNVVHGPCRVGTRLNTATTRDGRCSMKKTARAPWRPPMSIVRVGKSGRCWPRHRWSQMRRRRRVPPPPATGPIRLRRTVGPFVEDAPQAYHRLYTGSVGQFRRALGEIRLHPLRRQIRRARRRHHPVEDAPQVESSPATIGTAMPGCITPPIGTIVPIATAGSRATRWAWSMGRMSMRM